MISVRKELTQDDLVRLRKALNDHRLSASNGLCTACGVLRCEPWVDAFERLVMAGKLVSLPDNWLMRADRRGQ
ncbi:MAG TPA: hypothetical protein VJM46_03350 [Candidatus Saccharimonadales bacterium]|nr:hypothetical protein [Candidatus Saccharimonadales bacterium]